MRCSRDIQVQKLVQNSGFCRTLQFYDKRQSNLTTSNNQCIFLIRVNSHGYETYAMGSGILASLCIKKVCCFSYTLQMGHLTLKQTDQALVFTHGLVKISGYLFGSVILKCCHLWLLFGCFEMLSFFTYLQQRLFSREWQGALCSELREYVYVSIRISPISH